jgi:hypothetical protein
MKHPFEIPGLSKADWANPGGRHGYPRALDTSTLWELRIVLGLHAVST